MAAGNHAVEVQCLYSDDVPYHPMKRKEGAPPLEKPKEKILVSPVFPVLLDGEAGHSYKPRVHFERDDASGVPGCHVHMVDVTNEPGGEKVDLY